MKRNVAQTHIVKIPHISNYSFILISNQFIVQMLYTHILHKPNFSVVIGTIPKLVVIVGDSPVLGTCSIFPPPLLVIL